MFPIRDHERSHRFPIITLASSGFLHILSNMWFLWIFGDIIEARFGRLQFLAEDV